MVSRQPEVGARGGSFGRTVLGMASLCTGAPGRHQVWVRSRFRVTSGHTVPALENWITERLRLSKLPEVCCLRSPRGPLKNVPVLLAAGL